MNANPHNLTERSKRARVYALLIELNQKTVALSEVSQAQDNATASSQVAEATRPVNSTPARRKRQAEAGK